MSREFSAYLLDYLVITFIFMYVIEALLFKITYTSYVQVQNKRTGFQIDRVTIQLVHSSDHHISKLRRRNPTFLLGQRKFAVFYENFIWVWILYECYMKIIACNMTLFEILEIQLLNSNYKKLICAKRLGWKHV